MSTSPTYAAASKAVSLESAGALPSPGLILPALSLARRELVRFLRQRHRIVGALATPLVFWLLIGAGMGRSFAGAVGESYIQFFFPGTVVMILLFTAIFSTISVIEDRREGFLQSVLVAPVSREAVVLGKVLGGAALASGQGLLFLALAPLVGFRFTPVSLLLTAAFTVAIAFALTALGFCIAWRMDSSQGFHAIMNLFLIPMWFLSGALFPAQGAFWGLKWVMRINPLTYGVSGLRHGMLMAGPQAASAGAPGLPASALVTGAFVVAMFLLASVVARRDTAVDLR